MNWAPPKRAMTSDSRVVSLSASAAEPNCNVTAVMTDGVVDRLEVVEIDEEQSENQLPGSGERRPCRV